MDSIFNDSERDAIVERIQKVKSTDQPLWGKMNANEMICHLRDQLLVALGEKSCQRKASGFLTTWLGKRMAIDAFPWPKGKVQTVYEMDQKRGGTSTTELENDKKALIESIDQMRSFEDNFYDHPTFGSLNRKEWGRLAWKHLDHHLRQFGR